MVIGVIALLFFGRRLPEVGRSLGKGIVEFKKGLRDVENEVTNASAQPPSPPPAPPVQPQQTQQVANTTPTTPTTQG
jgi:sec-independent protein translocase protein TatA